MLFLLLAHYFIYVINFLYVEHTHDYAGYHAYEEVTSKRLNYEA